MIPFTKFVTVDELFASYIVLNDSWSVRLVWWRGVYYWLFVRLYVLYIYMPVSGVSSSVVYPPFSSVCRSLCDAVQLAPIRLWQMGHDRMVSTLATAVGGGGVSEILTSWVRNHAPPHEAHSWSYTLLSVHGNMFSYFAIQNNYHM